MSSLTKISQPAVHAVARTRLSQKESIRRERKSLAFAKTSREKSANSHDPSMKSVATLTNDSSLCFFLTRLAHTSFTTCQEITLCRIPERSVTARSFLAGSSSKRRYIQTLLSMKHLLFLAIVPVEFVASFKDRIGFGEGEKFTKLFAAFFDDGFCSTHPHGKGKAVFFK